MIMPVDAPSMESLKHGTTTVGIRVKEGVVLAADKRATAGHLIAHRKVKKIVKVTDKIAITIAGLVADAQALADLLKNQLSYYRISVKKEPTVYTAATLLSLVLYSSKWFPYIVQLLVGGYDNESRLYALDWFGTLTEEEYVATGSGSPIALGLLEEEYSRDLSIDEAVELARKAISSSIRRDTASGDGIDVAIITQKGYMEKTLSYISK